MVLQRDRPCPVWGSAAAGEKISVSLNGQTKSAKAGADGRWSVTLDAMAAGGPFEMTVTGKTRQTVKDVLVGEVWLATGGSNMAMPLKEAQIAQTEPDDSPVSMRRFFVVPKRWSEKPERDVAASWRSDRSETVADVSATAYFFSRELRKRLKVPVGILQASVDDSSLYTWISKAAFADSAALRRATFYQQLQQGEFEQAHATWEGRVRRAAEARKRGEKPPDPGLEPANNFGVSGHHGGMISPLAGVAMRGAILYQGEAEFFQGPRYRVLLDGLIKSWRTDWGRDFPVGWVQLPGYGAPSEAATESALPRFRQAQAESLAIPGTGMVVTIDLGEGDRIRPRNKEEVGRRLAVWADSQVFGSKEIYSGPMYDSSVIDGRTIRIKFKNLGGGLQMKGDRLTGFSIASAFRLFVPAKAVIEGDTVVVSSETYEWPTAVRYAWSDNPQCSLINREGFPACPFRTDSW